MAARPAAPAPTMATSHANAVIVQNWTAAAKYATIEASLHGRAYAIRSSRRVVRVAHRRRLPARADTREATRARRLPGVGGCRRSAILPRRAPDRLHATLGGQAQRQMGSVALDHERRRLTQSLPYDRLQPQVVARRNPPRLHRQRSAQRLAAVRAVDGRRRRDDAAHSRDRDAIGSRVVAGRQVDRVPHARAQDGEVGHRDAGRAQGREVDGAASRRDTVPLSSR